VPFLEGVPVFPGGLPPPHPIRSGRSRRERRPEGGRVKNRYMALHSICSDTEKKRRQEEKEAIALIIITAGDFCA
jgi:hypothetical protein